MFVLREARSRPPGGDRCRNASVPIPKFASPCGILSCELRNQGDYPGLDFPGKRFYRWLRQAGALVCVIALFGNCDISGYANAASKTSMHKSEIGTSFFTESITIGDVAININCGGSPFQIGDLVCGEWCGHEQSLGGSTVWGNARSSHDEQTGPSWVAMLGKLGSERKFAKVYLPPMQDFICGSLSRIFDYHSASWTKTGMGNFRSGWRVTRNHFPRERGSDVIHTASFDENIGPKLASRRHAEQRSLYPSDNNQSDSNKDEKDGKNRDYDISYLYAAQKILEPFMFFIGALVSAVFGGLLQITGDELLDKNRPNIGHVTKTAGILFLILSPFGLLCGLELWGLSLLSGAIP
jgi:hypothetical protein